MSENLGKAPIPGDNPAGINVRYEPEFEQLEAEISKLESVDQVGVRWQDVVAVSTDILTNKSKDLLVAAYLTAGLFDQQGWGGLREGLTACNDMAQTYWEDLFPPKRRARARGNALEWIRHRLDKVVVAAPAPAVADREALQTCVQTLRELQTFCDEQLGQNAPALGPLRRAIDGRLKEIPEPQAEAPPPPPPPPPAAALAPAPAPSASAPAPAPAVSAPAPVVVAPPTVSAAAPAPSADLSAVFKVVEQVGGSLVACADSIFAADPANADSYALRRFGTWYKSRFADVRPPEGGQLSFPGNKPGLNEELDALLADDQLEPVLRKAEPETSQRPFWLDPHYYVYRALDGLGKRYQKAAAAVENQVLAFVDRYPQVLELSFSNGAPLASGPTRLWISQARSKGEGGGEAGGGLEAHLQAALADARQQLLKGDLSQAVSRIRLSVADWRGGRAEFASRLALARLCLEAGRPELARGQLSTMQAVADRYHLEEWEPELVAQLLELRWRSVKETTDPDTNGGESAAELYGRLCSIDLGLALSLTQS